MPESPRTFLINVTVFSLSGDKLEVETGVTGEIQCSYFNYVRLIAIVSNLVFPTTGVSL